MPSYVEVANLAAASIGTETRITAPDENRTFARAVAAVWNMERRAALRDGAWNFAMARQALPALTDAPAFGFERAFALPTECLRLIEVTGVSRDAYQVEGRTILADAGAPLEIRYLRDVPEPAEWDDGFAHSFALRLAWRLGRKIAGSAFDRANAWREYRDSLGSAKTTDALETPPFDHEESDWVTSRFTGSSYDDALYLGGSHD